MQDQAAPSRLITVPLGLMEYRRALAVQQELHQRVAAGEDAAYLVFVEHPPVLTLGKHADPRHLRFTEAYFAEQGVDVVPIDRGGEVTAHEPGQLVMYPIVRLADFKLTPKSYVHLLEDAVIATLAGFGVEAARDEAFPGVWVGGDRKICAVGVRIKERASLHGIALNVVNGLELFAKIVPCGIQGRGVTSLAKEAPAGREPTVAVVQAALEHEMRTRLLARNGEARLAPSLHWGSETPIISS